MQNLELLNANGLDESILNTYSSCCGIDGDEYSNAISKEDAEMAAKAAESAAKVGATILKARGESDTVKQKKQLKAVCGRKPILGKKKKEKYKQCADKFFKSLEESKKPIAPPPSPTTERLAAPKEEEKFLGMPKAVGITVTIVGGLALLVGGFFLVKKLRK